MGGTPPTTHPHRIMRAIAAYLVFTASALSLTGYALQGVAAGLELQATERAELIRSIR